MNRGSSTGGEPNPRAQRLNKLFNAISYGDQPISPHNGPLFLEAICAQPDAAACVNKLIASPVGVSSVRAAMRYDLGLSFFNGVASNFIVYMQAPELRTIGGGSFLQQIISAIVEPPIFWDPFSQAFRAGSLQEKGQLSFGWLLLQLVQLPIDKAAPYRALAQDAMITDSLLASSHPATSAIGRKIKDILSTFNVTVSLDSDFVPGGRHDNDFADFRYISILPTAQEVMSRERPFLRSSSFLEDPATANNRLATYLDNAFRMLREDMIYELREELHIVLGMNNRKRRSLVIDGLVLVGFHYGLETRRSKWAIKLQCIEDLPQLKRKQQLRERKAYLRDEGKNILRHQSLTCLLVDDEVVAFPTVNRDDDLLSQNPPVILLQLTGEASTTRALLKLKSAKRIRLIQIDTAVFSFEPILKALQELTSLPLSRELVSWSEGIQLQNPPSMPTDVIEALKRDPSQDMRAVLNISKPNAINLDLSQAASLRSALEQRVSLIQGPPGTGKSFIGALLAKALHDSTSHTILVVCYTNHALDQFLEDLLDIGIPTSSIVRLGSKSTTRTAQFSLQMLQKQTRLYNLGKADWGEITELRSASEKFVAHLENAWGEYKLPNSPYDEVLDYLEFEHPEYHAAFQISVEQDGMTRAGKNGRRVTPYYLLERWIRGWDAGIYKNSANVIGAGVIWRMPQNLRHAEYAKWKTEMSKELILNIHDASKRYNDSLDAIDRKFSQNTAAVIRSKRIIGCTTTAAAKYREDIQSASPGVLLVEEAGEILESHVVTALGANTEQLILIGDHKQLRPKVNNYALSVERGDGFDLNMSMFERLVLKGYPHTTLSQQHRMRPEISALIRELTYPALVDADSTKTRQNIRGLQDNIIFLNHDRPEDENPEMKDRSETVASSSKRNTHEADMVLKIVKYLGQQGYGTDKLVILTPYLGQLQLLKSTLKKDSDPVLNDLDSFDLVRAGLVPEATAKLSKNPIRLATIDNYQGEESDIVICCLTRSNSDHDIGFMSSPERLNVLLSRARDGLIMIGNAETFLNARKGRNVWEKLFGLLKRGKHIYDGVPVRCERHPDRVALLKKPNDFDNMVPDGGCQAPCGTMLSCGVHQCPSKCHQLYDHSKMQCQQVVRDTCSNGHALTWKCHNGRPAACAKCEREAKLAGEKQQREFAEKQKRDAEEAEHAKAVAKLNEEIEHQAQALHDARRAREREAILRQKQQDLADASARASQTSAAESVTSAPSTLTQVSGAAAQSQSSSELQHPPSSSSKPDAAGSWPKNAPKKSHNEPARDPPSKQSDAENNITQISESESEKEWARQKSMEGASNAEIDAIMRMTGLEDVKKQILQIKAKIDVAHRQNIPFTHERFNVVLLGNPGTGKTTVARHYAKFLASLNVLPGDAFVEASGSSLANDGVAGTKKHIENILKAGGGTLFVDEAYQLTGDHNFQGSQVLDYLLAEMENRVGTIVFILAGYSKQMEKFFEHNPGLTSRVPYSLRFADYTDQELLIMMRRMIEKKYNSKMKLEDGFNGLSSRIAIKRLGRGRGREGFGNARALENLLARIYGRQADRLTAERKAGRRPDDFLLVREDLIGPVPSTVLGESPAWKKLQSLVGLNAVKQSIRVLFDLIEVNYQRELKEKDPVQMSLNRVFLGSPGTGKTTVANLYGQILAGLGLLSNGEVVLKNPADFIGSVLGESESKTKAILAATAGKVLIIDEAYMLYEGSNGTGKQSDPYKTAVIDTIVAEVQSTPGEDRCVLLLGYKDQIVEMFQNVNPGLSRRFAIENAFHFDDFSDSELLDILNWKLKDQDLQATDAAKSIAIEVLSRARNRPNFGNAGEVENLLGQAKARYQTRQAGVPPEHRSFDIVFEPQDFDPAFDRGAHTSANLDQLFQDVIGCEDIVRKLRGYQETARKMKTRGMPLHELIPTNFIMKGPPGTGKTTTARKMGQVYYDMGFLSSGEVVECSASDLVGQYVGTTGPKTKALLEKALGRVLFIDEAYRLSDGPFAKEAVDELVSILTQPRFLNKIVVLLAGYDQDMNQLLAINPGLSSRFSEEIIFNNMQPADCLQVLQSELRKKHVSFPSLDDAGSSAYKVMVGILQQLSALPSWGNARDMVTLAKQMISSVYMNASDDNSNLALGPENAIACMKTMLQERRSRYINLPTSSRKQPLERRQQTLDVPPPRLANISAAQNIRTASPERVAEQPVNALAEDDLRDPGVSDSVWAQLQKDKLVMQAVEEHAEQERMRLMQEAEDSRKREAAAQALAILLEEQRGHDAAAEAERKRRLEAARLKELEARAKRQREEAALKAAMEEEARRKQQEAKAQAALQKMGVCVAGYRWIKQQGGYRCAGGSHFVSDAALNI